MTTATHPTDATLASEIDRAFRAADGNMPLTIALNSLGVILDRVRETEAANRVLVARVEALEVGSKTQRYACRACGKEIAWVGQCDAECHAKWLALQVATRVAVAPVAIIPKTVTGYPDACSACGGTTWGETIPPFCFGCDAFAVSADPDPVHEPVPGAALDLAAKEWLRIRTMPHESPMDALMRMEASANRAHSGCDDMGYERDELRTLRTKIAAIDADRDALKARVAELESQSVAIANERDEWRRERDKYRSAWIASDQSVARLQALVGNAQQERDEVRRDRDARVANLETKIDAAVHDVDRITAERDRLTARVAELEGDVAKTRVVEARVVELESGDAITALRLELSAERGRTGALAHEISETKREYEQERDEWKNAAKALVAEQKVHLDKALADTRLERQDRDAAIRERDQASERLAWMERTAESLGAKCNELAEELNDLRSRYEKQTETVTAEMTTVNERDELTKRLSVLSTERDQLAEKLDTATDQVRFYRADRSDMLTEVTPIYTEKLPVTERDHLNERIRVMMETRDQRAKLLHELKLENQLLKNALSKAEK